MPCFQAQPLRLVFKTFRYVLIAFVWAGPAGSNAAGLQTERIALPAGFSINVYADDVPNARQMALSPGGVLFVGTREAGKVYAVVDQDRDGRADKVYTIATDLFMPSGLAFRDGDLYVAEVHRIIKFEGIESRLASPPRPQVVYDELPSQAHHGWKFIAFGPDDMLYVPVGAPCNICKPREPYGTILRMKPDGSDAVVYARGIRNSVGFTWHPITKEFWFTDNGRDSLGDDSPPDELNRVSGPGMHFGFPYVHGADILDPQFGRGADPHDYIAPAQNLGPHVAPLGLEFYTGSQFPSEYHGVLFIAEHGSWNRSRKIGYRITMVRLEANTRSVGYEAFATGWQIGETNWGRPVDLELMEDGSMLVSDDEAGVIYRISYSPQS